MMVKLIAKAGALSIGPGSGVDSKMREVKGKRTVRTDSLVSDRRSDTSGALRSDDNFSSIRYSFENLESERIIEPPRNMHGASCNYENLQADPGSFDADWPGG